MKRTSSLSPQKRAEKAGDRGKDKGDFT